MLIEHLNDKVMGDKKKKLLPVELRTFLLSNIGKSASEKHLNSDYANILTSSLTRMLNIMLILQRLRGKKYSREIKSSPPVLDCSPCRTGFNSQLANFRIVSHSQSSLIFILKQDFD